jgi:hypothetical protein
VVAQLGNVVAQLLGGGCSFGGCGDSVNGMWWLNWGMWSLSCWEVVAHLGDVVTQLMGCGGSTGECGHSVVGRWLLIWGMWCMAKIGRCAGSV